jgi:phytoene synthase
MSGEAGEEAEVRDAARQLDYDRYLCALLAPVPTRSGLLTIAAFHGEIARIPASVREPTIGAIRLQWWRDALENTAAQDATGSPVADSMRRALELAQIGIEAPLSIIDAYEALLHPGGLAEPGAVDAFADASQGAAFRLAAQILGASESEGGALIDAAAQSYGRVQLLRALPILLSKGHNPFGTGTITDWAPIVRPLLTAARDNLADVRRCAPLAPATIRQAVLPVALVEPYLRSLEGLGSKIALEQAEISPLSRVWRIFIAKGRQRF